MCPWVIWVCYLGANSPSVLPHLVLVQRRCCVSLVSTHKEARWSVRFFSLLTFDHQGYVQQTNKQNWTLHSNEQNALRSHSFKQTKERSGKGNNQDVPEQLDQESSITFEIYSDYACLKVSRETLRTIDSFLEQSRSIQSIYYFWNSLDLSSQSIRCNNLYNS